MVSAFYLVITPYQVARHLASEISAEAGFTLPSYHPYQVARHLASEISTEAALRVVALPHTEGLLYYLLDSLGYYALAWLLRLLGLLGSLR